MLLLLDLVDSPLERSCFCALEVVSDVLCIGAVQCKFMDGGELGGLGRTHLRCGSFGLVFKILEGLGEIVLLKENFNCLLNLHFDNFEFIIL